MSCTSHKFVVGALAPKLVVGALAPKLVVGALAPKLVVGALATTNFNWGPYRQPIKCQFFQKALVQRITRINELIISLTPNNHCSQRTHKTLYLDQLTLIALDTLRLIRETP
ncbi:MAG: hypothetical protein B6247_02080 [Candidatus Parabeggiatoa sp. nov. 2]|nr:MAG: hypothetical protein B6247_02080 [Beggiatoa sp. 4572_84]